MIKIEYLYFLVKYQQIKMRRAKQHSLILILQYYPYFKQLQKRMEKIFIKYKTIREPLKFS